MAEPTATNWVTNSTQITSGENLSQSTTTLNIKKLMNSWTLFNRPLLNSKKGKPELEKIEKAIVESIKNVFKDRGKICYNLYVTKSLLSWQSI